MLIRLFITIAFCISITACSSLQPQQIALAPNAIINKQLPNKNITLEVLDLRPSSIIGYRIDRFSNRAPISLKHIKPELETTIEKALNTAGLQVSATDGYFMKVILDNLKYQAASSNGKQHINVSVTMRIELSINGKSYRGRYSSNIEDTSLSTADKAKNQSIINTLFEQTLNRGLNDPKLIRFFQFN